MTEGHESDFLVQVRAQVMVRDESTEGWLPLAGGGLATVSIRKRCKLPDTSGHEYIIYGQRLSDQDVILSCAISRDLKYYKVMPTFHHWHAGIQRNGLTFQTAADARAFDKGIIRAYSELIDGLAKSDPSIVVPPLTKYDSVGEDEVFMTLDLPVETEQTSPEGSIRLVSPTGSIEREKENEQDRESIKYISATDKPPQSTLPSPITEQPSTSENYSYVTLSAAHDYNYPVVDQPAAAQMVNACRDSPNSLKKRSAYESTSDVTITADDGSKVPVIRNNNRLRCRYCHELYMEEWNQRGACEYAPDTFRSGFECISGMGCARCMLYHCMSDAEGETPSHPCECVSEAGCVKRWIGLTLLSLVVPCLWFYPPLRACHWIGVSCGVCGGKHKPQV